MKRYLTAALVLVPFLFTGCEDKHYLDDSVKNGEVVNLKFSIANADESRTKALLGSESDKNFLSWENGDKIGTFSVGSFGVNSTTSNNNAGTVVVDGSSYTLNVQVYTGGDITNIYSYYPFSATAGKNSTAAIISIPESQYMDVDGFDADAMPMAGSPIEVNLQSVKANTDTPCGQINFSNLGAIIKFKIYSSIDTDETLTSVAYSSGSGNLGGNYTIDLTSIDASNENTLELKGEGTKSEITTFCRTTPKIGTGAENAVDVYMVVAPGSYSETRLVVTTNKHTYSIPASGEKTFVRSHVKPMNVDIQKGEKGNLPNEEIWEKVTKAEDFTAGSYYILRGDGAYYLPNATGSNVACVAYSEGDPITDAMKWVAYERDGGLVLESYLNQGYYLWTTNTGNANSISVANSSSGESAANIWRFAICKGYYTATADGSRYIASFGNADWRYYADGNINSSNIPAEFYKLKDERNSVTLTFSTDSYELEVDSDEYKGFNPQTATIDPSSLSGKIVYAISDDSGIASGFDTSDGSFTLTGNTGTATITASYAGDDIYRAATASYTVKVWMPVSGEEKVESITSGTFSGDKQSMSMTTLSGITITQLKNDGNDVNNNDYNTVNTLRVYRANQIQFTGKQFTKIEISYTNSYSGAEWIIVDGDGSVKIDTGSKKVVWENASGAETVTLQNATASGTNTQLRTSSFDIMYSE